MRKFDYSELITRNWDNEILGYVAQIHEFKGRQELYLKQKPVELDRLIEIAKIQSTEASNEIEGIRTTSTRLKRLCEDKTMPKTRDEREIMGYRDVLNTIHDSYEYIPLRSNYILQLHRDLYRYSEKGIGGTFKNTQNYISATDLNGNSCVLFTPLAPYETPTAIDDICESFNHVIDTQEIDPLILIPIFIHDFLCIHPFSDGNGRMSRLLTILLLYRSGYFIGKYISIESKIAKNKVLYYDALEQSQYGWHENTDDPTPFIKYMLSIILSAYRDFEERVDLVGEKLSAIELVKRAAYGKIGKFTKTEIMELCPTISKASVEISMKKLVDDGTLIKHGNGRSTFYTRGDAE
ncbi:MAG: Fic family protein [Faecalibacterium sp.]|nr:Fic family protein [Ruminococcus sp.]MCM1391489.1 Fic family protein [Ruminococcus sp.]MCM1485253.1 Fic family protein [Faecalibacterium sp.]